MRPARATARQLCAGEAPAWGSRPEASRQPRRARLRKWTPHASGARLGFVSVALASGLILNDLRLMTGKNGHWITTPAVKLLDRDGNPRGDAAGKPIFNQIIEFRDGATADRFNEMVIALVRATDPTFPDGSAQ
jgi:DNA-binding cell septation regulator SpoVG